MALGRGDSAVQIWSLAPMKLRPLKRTAELENLDRESDDILQQMLDSSSATDSLLLLGHSGPVYGISFSPDRNLLLSSAEDSSIRLWSLQTFSNLICFRTGGWYPIWDVQFRYELFY